MCAYRVYKFPGALLRVSCPLIQIVEENRGFFGVDLPFFVCIFVQNLHSLFFCVPFRIISVSFPLFFSAFLEVHALFLCALLRILRIFLEFVSSSLLFLCRFLYDFSSFALASFFFCWHFMAFSGVHREFTPAACSAFICDFFRLAIS